jgi:photosystem I subunit 11
MRVITFDRSFYRAIQLTLIVEASKTVILLKVANQMVQAIIDSNDNPRDPRNREVIHPAFNDPQRGNLETPINASGFTKTFINNLPAYRRGLSSQRRGLEVGLAHGYWLIGPFAKFGPFRGTEIEHLSALLSTISIIFISTVAISLYASVHQPPSQPIVTTPNIPDTYKTQEGWSEYAGGFLIGGMGGAVFAYLLLAFVLNNPAFGSIFGYPIR